MHGTGAQVAWLAQMAWLKTNTDRQGKRRLFVRSNSSELGLNEIRLPYPYTCKKAR